VRTTKQRVLFWVVGVLALGALIWPFRALVWRAAGLTGNRLARTPEAVCLGNMLQMDAAAWSYCIENKLSFDAKIQPEWFAGYLKNSQIPLCPSGAKPYPPFTVQQGPRCPNSDRHNQSFIARGCRNAMSSLWDAPCRACGTPLLPTRQSPG